MAGGGTHRGVGGIGSKAMAGGETGTRARRRADQALVATYHEARLADLLEHVREGFAEYDAGRVDAFQLDDIIQQYKRATVESVEVLRRFRITGGVCGADSGAMAGGQRGARLVGEGCSPAPRSLMASKLI